MSRVDVRVFAVQPEWHRSVSDRVTALGLRQFVAVPRVGDELSAVGKVREVVWEADGVPAIYVESSNNP
jgi:hypothetical protein